MTYDLLCLTRSPYFIPKVWKTFESNRLKMEGATSFDGSYVADVLSVMKLSAMPSEAYLVDVVIHPRDLNLVFVAFSTGVVLFDLVSIHLYSFDLVFYFQCDSQTERAPIHRYELMIAPGCPGALGYNDPVRSLATFFPSSSQIIPQELMTARHPPISSIAVHASGQMFAIGCIDGTLAVWAVDDEESPLQVRIPSLLPT